MGFELPSKSLGKKGFRFAAPKKTGVCNSPSNLRPPFTLPVRPIARRQNLTLRMGSKRFARLSNGFSKKIDCHLAAVSLYVAFYNLCRTHEALRMTPAMALGITDHVWSVAELIKAALKAVPTKPTPTPSARRKSFRVIEGGKN
jgi:hypothetical protein